jgi:hypothetical protein
LYQAGFPKNQISAGKKHRQFAGLAFEDTHRDECVHVVSFSVYCAIRQKNLSNATSSFQKKSTFSIERRKKVAILFWPVLSLPYISIEIIICLFFENILFPK